jgi:hypothetical protein
MDGGPTGYYLMLLVVIFSLMIITIDNKRNR